MTSMFRSNCCGARRDGEFAAEQRVPRVGYLDVLRRIWVVDRGIN